MNRKARPHDYHHNPALPGWQADRLAVLLDALDGVTVADAERASLEWLAGWEKHTVENIAAVIVRARAAVPWPEQPPQRTQRPGRGDPLAGPSAVPSATGPGQVDCG